MKWIDTTCGGERGKGVERRKGKGEKEKKSEVRGVGESVGEIQYRREKNPGADGNSGQHLTFQIAHPNTQSL